LSCFAASLAICAILNPRKQVCILGTGGGGVMEAEKVVIIGSGPAGLTAALYAFRLGRLPLVIEGPQPGGQLMGTSNIENWPGEQKIQGALLMQKMREQVQGLGVRFVSETATGLEKCENGFVISTKNSRYPAQAVIIATGSAPRKLGCPGEAEYWGKGVSSCSVCDGPLFAGRPVVVVGGGDSAAENAQYLARLGSKVTLVHALGALTASRAMQEMVLSNPAITIIYDSTVTGIEGDGIAVTGVVITNSKTKSERTIPTDGVFIAIGLIPNTQFCRTLLECRPSGHIITTSHTQTSVEGIYAAGDVADMRYRQAIAAAGSGCMAALDVDGYLKKI